MRASYCRIVGLAGLLLATPLLSVCSASSGTPVPPPTRRHITGMGPSALYVSPDGQDQAPGTETAPLRTIGRSLELAGAGTTVWIAQGTYHEPLVTVTGGRPGAELVFRSWKGTAELDGSTFDWPRAADQNRGIVELRHPYVRLVGLHITHSADSGVILGADHLSVGSCEIDHVQRHAVSTDTGLQAAAGRSPITDVTLEGNDVHDATLSGSGNGQAISLIADGFVVVGNRVHANRDIGIDVWLGARHGEVRQNEVWGNRSTGIYVDGASYVRIDRNRVHHNQNGIVVSSEDGRYDTHDIWVDDNVVYEHPDSGGCGIWDPDIGASRVLFAHNTLYDNKTSFHLAGRQNDVTLVNNLGYAHEDEIDDHTRDSRVSVHDNVWLPWPTGFVAPEQGDFRLQAGSPALDRCPEVAPFGDDRGHTFRIDVDAAGSPRVAHGRADAGAYEYP